MAPALLPLRTIRSVLDQPRGSGIDVLHTDIDGILERIVPLRRGDKRLAVPAAGGAQPVVDGNANPAFFTKVVIKRIAKGIYPGAHGPGTAKGIDEDRAFFRRLVFELIDIHQDGLTVANDEFHGRTVRFGNYFRRLWRLCVRMDGQRPEKHCAENHHSIHSHIIDCFFYQGEKVRGHPGAVPRSPRHGPGPGIPG